MSPLSVQNSLIRLNNCAQAMHVNTNVHFACVNSHRIGYINCTVCFCCIVSTFKFECKHNFSESTIPLLCAHIYLPASCRMRVVVIGAANPRKLTCIYSRSARMACSLMRPSLNYGHPGIVRSYEDTVYYPGHCNRL